jgi:hypothetical protein
MKNKNIALIAVLFTISVFMAFANGPTPPVYIDTSSIVDGAVTAIKTDGSIALTENTYTKAEIDMDLAQLETELTAGSLILHYNTATDTVTGGRLLTTESVAVATSITYAALATTTYVQVNAINRLSEVGQPGVVTIPAGTITGVRFFSKTAGGTAGRSVTGVDELWAVDADGTSNPAFIASSTEYVLDAADGVVQRASVDWSLPTDFSMGAANRRFMMKHYRKRTGTLTGTDPVVTVYYGGIYAAFLKLGLPSAVVMKTDGSNASSTVVFTDIQAKTSAGVKIKSSAGATAITIGAGGPTVTTADGVNVGGNLQVASHTTLTTASATVITAGSATATGTTRITNNGFTQLGELGTGIKMKVLTGTTGATEGSATSIAHGLTVSKIVATSVSIEAASGGPVVGPNTALVTGSSGYLFRTFNDTNNVEIQLSAADSGYLTSDPITVVIWYVE